ncbi:MAG: hypothetical protein QHG99_05750 [Methanomicrobiales archaeon]|nr:hypothetical protein [Methanomicrobiales archaeon]
MMRIRGSPLLILVILLLGVTAGCVSASIGQVRYHNQTLLIQATNEDVTQQAVLQVTVDQIRNFHQYNVFRRADFIEFKSGAAEYGIPVTLEPGNYKVYIYIIVDGDSKARVIRDLTVE